MQCQVYKFVNSDTCPRPTTGMLRVYVGGFLLPMAAAVSITTYMLCLVASRRPSKTDPYNTAMIMSHAITLVVLISSVGLKFPQVGPYILCLKACSLMTWRVVRRVV